jgi:hypothetical protein
VLKQEQRKKLTNDELLYDPELDNQDELWMKKKLSRMLIYSQYKIFCYSMINYFVFI